ncbi:MAG: alanine racemase domain protein [Paenibacillaceae bacterium]|jgi:pyridoxal phosphate enzyme (YggS family)|nr:alanine racemase domain protein [Paenibacillaceae bacterium]
MDILDKIRNNIDKVEASIQAACERSGRLREDVTVIAVTKYVSLGTMRIAMQAGLTEIGENRWQDAEEKWQALGSQGTWHFIGHLQTNKVKDVVGKFAYIHSLDRLSLAEEINKRAAKLGIVQPCLIQLNISGEESKYGLEAAKLESFASQIAAYSNIRIAGLMTMAPLEAEAEATRPVFRGLRECRDRLNGGNIFPYQIHGLSMGMSNDYEVAVEEGATWVRLGSTLVGKEVE